MNYPDPPMHVLHPIQGRWLIKPVALEDYDRGYNPMVEDVYEVMTTWHPHSAGADGGVYLNQWLFEKRVRVFSKPMHVDNGKRYRCKACERYYRELWPKGRDDETLLVRHGEHPNYSVGPP